MSRPSDPICRWSDGGVCPDRPDRVGEGDGDVDVGVVPRDRLADCLLAELGRADDVCWG